MACASMKMAALNVCANLVSHLPQAVAIAQVCLVVTYTSVTDFHFYLIKIGYWMCFLFVCESVCIY